MTPHDPTRRRLLIGLAGVVGLGAVGGVAWLLGEGGTQTAATTSSSTSNAPPTTVATTTTTAPSTSTTSRPATTTTPPGSTVSVICREAWGAQPPTGPFTEHTIERITVHHTATLLEDNRLAPGLTRQHQADHQELGWPDLAYHFLIDRNGHIYEGRPYAAVGDTRTSYDPTGHLLIAVKGNFEEQELTEAQLESLVAMVAWGVGEFDVPTTEITGHRDWAATACPGKSLYALIESGEVAATVEDRLAVGPVTFEVACDDRATQLVEDIEAGLR